MGWKWERRDDASTSVRGDDGSGDAAAELRYRLEVVKEAFGTAEAVEREWRRPIPSGRCRLCGHLHPRRQWCGGRLESRVMPPNVSGEVATPARERGR